MISDRNFASFVRTLAPMLEEIERRKADAALRAREASATAPSKVTDSLHDGHNAVDDARTPASTIKPAA